MTTKKTRYTAEYEGRTATRTSARPYRFAAVVRWSDGEIAVGAKWSTTEKGAAACLTGQQKENGARVIAIVPAIPERDAQSV